MNRIRLLAFVYLLAGIVAACDSVAPSIGGGSPNVQGAERLYVRSVLRPYIYGVDPGGWRHTYLLLLENGTAYRGLPRGVPIGGVTREQLLALEPTRVGTYLEQGGLLNVS